MAMVPFASPGEALAQTSSGVGGAGIVPRPSPESVYNVEVQIGDKIFGLPASGRKGDPIPERPSFHFSVPYGPVKNGVQSNLEFGRGSLNKASPGLYDGYSVTYDINIDPSYKRGVTLYIHKSNNNSPAPDRCSPSDTLPCDGYLKLGDGVSSRYSFRVGSKASDSDIEAAKIEAGQAVRNLLDSVMRPAR